MIVSPICNCPAAHLRRPEMKAALLPARILSIESIVSMEPSGRIRRDAQRPEHFNAAI
jgi:hypothetical protein